MAKNNPAEPSPTEATTAETTPEADRRRAPRSGLSVPCCLRAAGRLRSSVGRTRNVSASGALVQLPPGGPELASGDGVMLALVPPATGLVDAGELKPARVVRVSESVRGSACVALAWDAESVPGLVAESARPIEPSEAA